MKTTHYRDILIKQLELTGKKEKESCIIDLKVLKRKLEFSAKQGPTTELCHIIGLNPGERDLMLYADIQPLSLFGRLKYYGRVLKMRINKIKTA